MQSCIVYSMYVHFNHNVTQFADNPLSLIEQRAQRTFQLSVFEFFSPWTKVSVWVQSENK